MRAAILIDGGYLLKRLPTVRKDIDGRDPRQVDKAIADLTDADFEPGFRQKAVDMRIGLDIASITLKKQADTIILVAGDSDFVPAAKLARREGGRFILDPLWRSVDAGLFEHIDALRSGFAKPRAAAGVELVGEAD